MSAQPSSRRQFLRHATGAGLGLRLGVGLGLGVELGLGLGGAAWLGAGVAIANATAPAARPFQPPAPARWSYAVEAQLRGIPFKADARMEWAHDGERYRASSEFQVPLLGKRRQTSTGRITPAGLLPERFTDESRRLRSVDFDHARGQILYTPGGGGHHGAPLPAGVQDRLSLFLQLAGWLAGTMATGAGHARPEPGSVWTLPVTGRSHAAPWSFEWLAPERLAVPAGAEQAWPLRRQPRNANDETLALWLVPAWGFAPARIEVRETDGDVVNQVLTQRL